MLLKPETPLNSRFRLHANRGPNRWSCARRQVSRDCCTAPAVATSRATMLAEIYGWFTEGFDTADLKEAKALLEKLGGN
jgi:hypothetical protein